MYVHTDVAQSSLCFLDNYRSEAGAETGGNQHRRLGEASARDEFSGEAGSGQPRDRDTPSSREFSGEKSDTRWRC